MGRGTARRHPIVALRGNVLRPDCDFTKVWRAIAAAYGLPKRAAIDAAIQLERLLANRGPESTSFYAEYEAWKLGYSRILRQIATTSSNTDTTVSNAEEWAVFAKDLSPSIAAMKTSWAELDKAKREKLWPRMIQSMLSVNPELLPSFLQATYDPAWSQFYVVEDVVRLILLRTKQSDTVGHESLVDLVCFLMSTDVTGHLQLGQDIIGTLISRTGLNKAIDLFQHFEKGARDLNPQTLLQFAGKFATSKENKALAAEILCSMANTHGFDINSPAASSVCTALLHLPEGEIPEGVAAPDELFGMLLEAGLRPNLLNITALMRNFCVRGHLDTAWTVFDLLVEYGIEPDEHVYSTLLHASKRNLDVASVQRVMASIHSHETWNAAIVNDFLDIMVKENEGQSEKRRRQKKDNNAFRPLLHVYAKFFRLEPLQKLCNFPLEDYLLWQGPVHGKSSAMMNLAAALLPRPSNNLMEPDTITLSLMLSAAIRGAPRFYSSLRNGVPAMLGQINHFNQLFDTGDVAAVSIVEKHGSLIYDVFLRGMLQFQQCLHPAVQLVRDMLERASAEQKRYGRNLRYPRPSVHTWTMLVNGFKNHHQPGIAASMVRMMIKEGDVKPNMVTWNALITAFARANDAQGAVKSIRYLEQSGLRPDRHTISAISSMNTAARKQALSLMEASKEKLIPPDDDVAPLLAAPHPRNAHYPDPVVQQLKNDNAPPLSNEAVWDEMQRLTKEGDALLSDELEVYNEEDFPEPLAHSTGPFGVAHPRNANQLMSLLGYKKEVDAFIARIRTQPEVKATTLIETTQPIAKPIKPPAQASHVGRLKRIWNEAYEARNQLRDLNPEVRPIGIRPWEEGLQWRLKARAANFRERPIGVEKKLDGIVPLGIVAQQDRAPHPRVAASRQLNPELRRDRTNQRLQARSRSEEGENPAHD